MQNGRDTGTYFCENIPKKLIIPPCVSFNGHIRVFGQHLKSRFYVPHNMIWRLKYKVSHSNQMGTWESYRYFFVCENSPKMFKISSREWFYGHFRVCRQHYKTSWSFLCTKYSFKHVIEYHKGDKMSIWAIYKPIRAKIHNFLWFREIASLAV